MEVYCASIQSNYTNEERYIHVFANSIEDARHKVEEQLKDFEIIVYIEGI